MSTHGMILLMAMPQKIKPTVLRGLQKYTPVVCHANGRFRKTLIPPRTTRAGSLSGGCNETRRHFYKPQGRLGLIQMTNLQLCRHRPTLTAGLQIDTAMLFGTANYLRVWRYDIRRTKKIQTFQPDVFGSVSVGMFCVPESGANRRQKGDAYGNKGFRRTLPALPMPCCSRDRLRSYDRQKVTCWPKSS